MPLRNNTSMASNFLAILNQLHDAHVDFVIVGGVAAALHGGSRVTFDLDVVPSLAPDSWTAAVELLWSLGARPRIPESLDRIRDVDQVRRWRKEKVDLLVSESDQFEALRQRAARVTIERRTFFVASLDDLLALKQRAGRPQDLLDIAELQDIKKRLGSQGPGGGPA
jgi:predicted nucleotidyltransferase